MKGFLILMFPTTDCFFFCYDILRNSINLLLTFQNALHAFDVFRDLAFLYVLLGFLICLRIAVIIQGGSECRIQTVLFGMHSVDSVIM